MPPKKPALGRGLEALLPAKTTNKAAREVMEAAEKGTAGTLPINKIQPNKEQPRVGFDPQKMEELAESIKRHGIIQPLAVMPVEDGEYRIVAGERRWRASQQAGLTEVPVIILQPLAPDTLLEFALVENLQREDLLPMEEAKAYHSLQRNFGLSAELIAERVGKSRSTVANALRLLTLRVDMQEDIDEGRLTPGHARAILSLDNMRDQVRLRDTIMQSQLSVRQAENRARQMIEAGAMRRGKTREKAIATDEQRKGFDHIQRLRDQLVDALACRVNISVQGESRGKIEIYYESLDDLQNLLDALEISI